MPVYQLDVQKRLNTEFFTNRYFVSGATLTEAAAASQDVPTLERAFHGSAVEFVNFRVSTLAEDDGAFITQPLGYNGLGNPGDYLPLWNVIRAEFSNPGTRPYYKLYRGCLGENVVSGSVIDPAFFEVVSDAVEQIGIITVAREGLSFGPTVVRPRVAMRQLRRGQRKRTQPIIPA